jgi:hypothetical protein
MIDWPVRRSVVCTNQTDREHEAQVESPGRAAIWKERHTDQLPAKDQTALVRLVATSHEHGVAVPA